MGGQYYDGSSGSAMGEGGHGLDLFGLG